LLSINSFGDSLETLRDWIKVAAFILTLIFIKFKSFSVINNIRPRKRFNKWIKAEKIEAIEVIKEYYGYSTEKARQVLPLLDESKLDYLRTKLIKGGRNG
jgi:thiosulfate reductase cytochrome b subunit